MNDINLNILIHRMQSQHFGIHFSLSYLFAEQLTVFCCE